MGTSRMAEGTAAARTPPGHLAAAILETPGNRSRPYHRAR